MIARKRRAATESLAWQGMIAGFLQQLAYTFIEA
jgi:hypothetical protein